MQTYNEPGLVNIETGEDLPIKDLALLIKDIVGFTGTLEHGLTNPDGAPGSSWMSTSSPGPAGLQKSASKQGSAPSMQAFREKIGGKPSSVPSFVGD